MPEVVVYGTDVDREISRSPMTPPECSTAPRQMPPPATPLHQIRERSGCAGAQSSSGASLGRVEERIAVFGTAADVVDQDAHGLRDVAFGLDQRDLTQLNHLLDGTASSAISAAPRARGKLPLAQQVSEGQ